MIYKDIETTMDEVLDFIRDAGIDIKDDITAGTFQIKYSDDCIIEMPPDLNIFVDMPIFTYTGSYFYEFSNSKNENNTYISGSAKQGFDNYANPLKYILAA